MGMIRYEVSGAVVTLTLNRPDKLNAFTIPMLRELHAALRRAADDPALRVLVLTGEGRAFGTGQDLNDPSLGDVSQMLAEVYAPLVMELMAHRLVTVAALNGITLGAAANIALACDIAVASDAATYSQAFVKIGLIPDAGGTWLLPRIVGLRNAMALVLSGDAITAAEAQAMGLVYRVFPAARFAAEVAAFAERLASNSPLACRMIKETLRASLDNTLPQQLALEAKLQGEASQSETFHAALAAFREKRRQGAPG